MGVVERKVGENGVKGRAPATMADSGAYINVGTHRYGSRRV